MTNSAMRRILDTLCQTARDSAQAALCVLDPPPNGAVGEAAATTCREASKSSADRLLRSVEDLQELFTQEPLPEKTAETFNAASSLEEIVSLLRLAAEASTGGISVAPPAGPVHIKQDRQAVEQALARIVDAVWKLEPTRMLAASIAGGEPDALRLDLANLQPDLAFDVSDWLNIEPDHVQFREHHDVALAVGVMVAGKRLRALGGRAELTQTNQPTAGLTIMIPSLSADFGHHFRLRLHPSDPLHILMAEDCDDSFALSQMLLGHDHITRARNGIEAVEMVTKQRFNVVLMDVHMPDMDGYSAIRAIRDWETQTGNVRTPIVVLSSDDLATQRRFAAHSGCSGFLRKPLRKQDFQELRNSLRSSDGA